MYTFMHLFVCVCVSQCVCVCVVCSCIFNKAFTHSQTHVMQMELYSPRSSPLMCHMHNIATMDNLSSRSQMQNCDTGGVPTKVVES